jgi:hypothetical protein
MDEEYAWLTPEEAAKLLILKTGETQDTPIRFPPPKPWEEQSYAEQQWRLEQRQRRADQAAFDEAVNKVADMIRSEQVTANQGTLRPFEAADGLVGGVGATNPTAPFSAGGVSDTPRYMEPASLRPWCAPSPWSSTGQPLSLAASLGLLGQPPVPESTTLSDPFFPGNTLGSFSQTQQLPPSSNPRGGMAGLSSALSMSPQMAFSTGSSSLLLSGILGGDPFSLSSDNDDSPTFPGSRPPIEVEPLPDLSDEIARTRPYCDVSKPPPNGQAGCWSPSRGETLDKMERDPEMEDHLRNGGKPEPKRSIPRNDTRGWIDNRDMLIRRRRYSI